MSDTSSTPTPKGISRRVALSGISAIFGAIAGAIVGLPLVGFVVAPLFRKQPPEWRAVGRVDQFKIGETVSVAFENAGGRSWGGVAQKSGAWLRRVGEQDFVAFCVNCSHLGCPVSWEAGAELFMCPCHGGVYYSDGRVAAGPPPRDLTRYEVRVQDGAVEIQTSPIPIA